VRPDISISSDFIIGFPGENEQDFTDTMALINEVIFDKSFNLYSSAVCPRFISVRILSEPL
jgi:tRNA-2-methylthio-N6-dimethylallyladenosine synthase